MTTRRTELALLLLALGCGGGSSDDAAGGNAGAGGSGASVAAGGSSGLGASGGGGGAAATGGTAGGGAAGSGPAGAGGAGAGGAGATTGCLVGDVLSTLGRSRLLLGASMEDAQARAAPFDLRYVYIAGTLADGDGPCASCASGCTSQGQSCANSGPGCGWWGCWQWDQAPPGEYARGFFSKVTGDGQIPMVTWYRLLQASGVGEGAPEVTAANDTALMRRYLADYRFFLQQIGRGRVLVHLEPDFWGYAQHVNDDPTRIPAAVARANPDDCGGLPDTIAGLGRCLVAMTRRHAPGAKVALHASSWGTRRDVFLNADPRFDVAGEARKLADFLLAAGAGDGDFIVVDAADRDAAWYDTQGQNRWWNEDPNTLPNFQQALAWSRALAERMGKAVFWWQMPVGNMTLPNLPNQWRDNRLDWFLDHLPEVAAAHGFGIAFGAGQGDQTHPGSDGGHLLARVQAIAAAGGQAACP